MNPNQNMTPASILDYLTLLQRQRQAQGQGIAQMLPPQGATAPAMAPFAFQPQAAMPAPPITETRTIAPAPTVAAPRVREMQGPLLDEMRVKGFDIGAGSFGTAQEYADRFAGGDLGKVKARTIIIDGQPVNDYYTRGFLDSAPAPASAAGAPNAAQDPNLLQRIFGFFNLPSLGG